MAVLLEPRVVTIATGCPTERVVEGPHTSSAGGRPSLRRASLTGQPPAPQVIDMSADTACASKNPNAVSETVVVKDGVAHVQAGGGTVADARPDYEYEESRAKARGVVRAIELAASQADWA